MARKGFERAWRTPVPAAAFDGLLAELLDVMNIPATSAGVQTSSARHERLKTRAKG
jgi:D-alanine-D-alanine ligase-like ATP-grasp enzyme